MNTPIRLLLVNTVKTTQNGQTTFLLNYLRNMDREGMTIGFAAANSVEQWVRDELAGMGVTLYELPYRNRKPLKYVRALMKIIREGGYNIVHAHGNSATLAFNGEVYNTKKQKERDVSDVIYFASAIDAE